MPPAETDLALLIGILCPLSLRISKALLKGVAQYVRGGMIIYSTALHKMLIEDPLADAIMRLADWHMVFKSEKESEDLAKLLGLKVIGKFFDEPFHYHCMVVAQVP